MPNHKKICNTEGERANKIPRLNDDETRTVKKVHCVIYYVGKNYTTL